MATWVDFELAGGGVDTINADLVQRVRVFDGVTRLVFGAMPGGYDEVAVAGSKEAALAALRVAEHGVVDYVEAAAEPRYGLTATERLLGVAPEPEPAAPPQRRKRPRRA